MNEKIPRTSVRSRAKAKPPVTRRLRRGDRKLLIIRKSIKYFSEHGFDCGTRVLAQHIGVSQSLLYHYFASKDELIESVYVYLFESRWSPRWESIFTDEELSRRDKLVVFYCEYFQEVLNSEWTRIFLHGALRDMDLHKRNFDIVRERIFPLVIREIRGEDGLSQEPATAMEQEIAWNLHSAIFYLAIRKWVLKLEGALSIKDSIALAIDVFLDGADKSIKGARKAELLGDPT